MTNETNETYNGWTNYETWVVKLWMDNGQGSQRYFADLTQSIYDDAEITDYSDKMQSTAYELSKRLKSDYEDNNPLPYATGVYTDLLNAALSVVNWREIAESLLSEIETEIEGDEVI